MTNTINNVPRELLERLALQRKQDGWLEMNTAAAFAAAKELRAFLDATSPAGVDGLEVVGEVVEIGDGLGTKLTVWNVDLPVDAKLYTVPVDAQAIIDGLRGEVAKISSDRAACWAEFKVMTKACLDAEKERDQLAGLLREWRRMFDGGLASGQLGVLRGQTDTALAELPR